MFKKEINPYSVTDKVTFRNVDETITVRVRADAGMLMAGLNEAQKRLSAVAKTDNREEYRDAAVFFARAIFGDDGDKLVEFYGDPVATIAACGMYFDKRLKKLITKAQKK